MQKTLGLALVAATLLATPALASGYRLPTANLDTPAGHAKFEQKLRRAAHGLCSGRLGREFTECTLAVREEALSKLPAPQRLAYERSRTPVQNTALASL